MLTIYSTGRAISSNTICFPSVEGDGGEDWQIRCRGVGLTEGLDFLVSGEVLVLGGGPVLAVAYAVVRPGTPYFCRVAGVADNDGQCAGMDAGQRGGFAGELFAVDGNKLRVAGRVGSGEGGTSGSEAASEGEVGSSVADGGRGEPGVGAEIGDRLTESGRGTENPPDEAKSEDSEMAEILRVAKPVEAEDFPVAGALPELSDVKRDDLARKAESRKKGETKLPKKSNGDAKVSKGGIRLGKGSSSDTRAEGGHNSIDESELW